MNVDSEIAVREPEGGGGVSINSHKGAKIHIRDTCHIDTQIQRYGQQIHASLHGLTHENRSFFPFYQGHWFFSKWTRQI
jgi:hypothetical protein